VDQLSGAGVEGRGTDVAAVDRLGGMASRAAGDGAGKMTGRWPAVSLGWKWHGVAPNDIQRSEVVALGQPRRC
jgi:hypothetical protein